MFVKALISCFIFSFVFSNTGQAQVFKCILDGKTTYQQEPCPEIQTNTALSSQFGFDGWEFGMYIHDVKQKARLRQIAMSPGKSTFISSYNEKVALLILYSFV